MDKKEIDKIAKQLMSNNPNLPEKNQSAAVHTSEKKHCPMCWWTDVTNLTHCPVAAEGSHMVIHNYQWNVPLVTSGPDTSNQHKYEKRDRGYKPNPLIVNQMAKETIRKQGGIKPDLDTIRMMQQRARKTGKIKDNHFD